jgi:succinate dehydrogenase / fumarate reductase cytochrome b subunit
MTFKQLFTSSIGKKFTMGLTGLFLISFLVIHCTVNSMIFFNDNGDMFNYYAHFMSHNYIVRFLEIGLFAGLITHIIQGLSLWQQNNAARPVKYAVNAASTNSKWYSRSMGLLGTLLLFFLILHVSKFFVGTKVALYANGGERILSAAVGSYCLYGRGNFFILAFTAWFSKCISNFGY